MDTYVENTLKLGNCPSPWKKESVPTKGEIDLRAILNLHNSVIRIVEFHILQVSSLEKSKVFSNPHHGNGALLEPLGPHSRTPGKESFSKFDGQ